MIIQSDKYYLLHIFAGASLDQIKTNHLLFRLDDLAG